MDQTLESFEINRDRELWETSKQIVTISDQNQQQYEVSESDSLELENVQFKCEVFSCDEDEQISEHVEGATKTNNKSNVAQQADRLSIDQRSTCSPSTTTPNTVPNNIIEIKKEPPDESTMTTMRAEGETQVFPPKIQRSISNVENGAIKRISSDECHDLVAKKSKFDTQSTLKLIDHGENAPNGKYQ